MQTYNPIPGGASAGWMGDPRRGAALGRPSRAAPSSAPLVMRLRHVRLDSGGYDAGGAYWGHHKRLYTAFTDDGAHVLFFRADDRAAARAHALGSFPNAKVRA